MLDARVQTKAMLAGTNVWYIRFQVLQFQGFPGSSGPSQSSMLARRSLCFSSCWREGREDCPGVLCFPDSRSTAELTRVESLDFFDDAEDIIGGKEVRAGPNEM